MSRAERGARFAVKDLLFARQPWIKRIWAFNRDLRDRWVGDVAQRTACNSTVIDLGAGSCPHASAFSHCRYFPLDLGRLEPEQLQGRGGYGRLSLRADAHRLPFRSSSVDVVLCTEVLEHLVEPMAALAEITRVLKPGGQLVLSAPLRSGLHQEPFHYFGGFTPWFYQHAADRLGLAIAELAPVGGLVSAYAEEGLRVLIWLLPRRQDSILVRILLTVLLLLALPGLLFFWPLFSFIVDRRRPDYRFTLGFHLLAVKRSSAECSPEFRQPLGGEVLTTGRRAGSQQRMATLACDGRAEAR